MRCIEKRAKPIAVFETRIVKADGTLVGEGAAEIEVPTQTIVTAPSTSFPTSCCRQTRPFRPSDRRSRSRLPALPTVVVCPDDRNALGGAVLSATRRA